MIKRLGCLFVFDYFLASCTYLAAPEPPLCYLPPLPEKAVIRYDVSKGGPGVTEMDEGGLMIIRAYDAARSGE